GTNANVILEEAPEPEPGDPPARPPQLLVLSAKTPEALAAAAARLADHLEARDSKEEVGAGETSRALADTAWTLQTGRQTFEHRGFAVARDPRSAVGALRDPSPPAAARRRSAVFLFTG